jgi:multisubunit Na+/H+ antiporter MnhC subunit
MILATLIIGFVIYVLFLTSVTVYYFDVEEIDLSEIELLEDGEDWQSWFSNGRKG